MDKQKREEMVRERRRQLSVFGRRIRKHKAESDEERYAYALKHLKRGEVGYLKKNKDKVTNKWHILDCF